jgi:acyl-coenzyme A thioesterase 13
VTDAPEGFEHYPSGADFLEFVGPVFCRHDGDDRIFGIRAEDRHRNANGFVQGGVLATLADFTLGRAIESDADDDRPRGTVSLTVDYLKPVTSGSWIEGRGRVDRVGGTLAFADCSLTVEGSEVVRARAVFAAIG